MTDSPISVAVAPDDGARVIEPEPNCVFCPGNGKVEIVRDLGSMYVVRAKDPATMEDLGDRWLIIPAEHAESLDDLSIDWGVILTELVYATGLTSGFNLSLNVGPEAGQTMSHLHWWLIDRSTDELGKGMSWMIDEIARLYLVNRELSGENARLKAIVSLPLTSPELSGTH
jgi:diadenosine tetraphosphate (Ap4A) HIT family hydrolase